MRRVLRWPLLLLLPATLLSVGMLHGLVTDTAYDLTCCTQAEIDRLWQPGTTVELHWTVQSESGSLIDRVHDRFENPTHKVFVTAFLSGPYSELAGLNQMIQTGTSAGDIPAVTVSGSVTAMDDRTLPSTTPVTTFVLPTDLAPGYYDLNLIWRTGTAAPATPTTSCGLGRNNSAAGCVDGLVWMSSTTAASRGSHSATAANLLSMRLRFLALADAAQPVRAPR